MAAQIHHVGRRTGTPYVTSVGARVRDGIVLVPLTFGNRSYWARNVYAARMPNPPKSMTSRLSVRSGEEVVYLAAAVVVAVCSG